MQGLWLSFPEIEAMLVNGKMSLCTASYAFGKLNEENKDEILPKLSGASKREVERIFVFKTDKNKETREEIKPIASNPPSEQSKEDLPILKASSTANKSTATGGGNKA